ncbi:MAG: alpha-glucosidase [Bdellovibrionales bacterium]|nr:alpha-glucosidase [Bdellovibrionales bacterium]
MIRYVLLVSLVCILAICTLTLTKGSTPADLERNFPEYKSSSSSNLDFETNKLHFSADNKQLRVKGEYGEILSVDLTEAFLTGSLEGYTATESRGSFRFNFKQSRLCETQTYESLKRLPAGLTLSGSLTCQGQNSKWTLKAVESDAGELRLSLTSQPKLSRLLIRLGSRESELFFGAGAQYTHLKLNGHKIPIWISEQGIGRGLQPLTFLLNLIASSGGDAFTTYLSSASLISSESRGFLWNATDLSILDLSNSSEIVIDVFGEQLEVIAMRASSPKNLLTQVTEHTGRMKALPDWIHRSAMVGLQGGTDKVRSKLKKLTQHGAAISSLWLQDWVGQRKTSIGKQLWWNWSHHRKHYKDWERFRSELSASGIRTLGYINPMLTEPSPNQAFNYHEQAKQLGYFVKSADSTDLRIQITSFDAGLVDLTNPEAVAWLKAIIRQELVKNGFSGWMADFAEALPTDSVLYDGAPKSFHNSYSVAWTKLNREVIDEFADKELVSFHRSGFTKSPEFATLFWAGDQLTNWDKLDGLHSSLIAILSSGLSGISFNHSDTGGYTSINLPLIRQMRTEELFLRWIEMNTFTTLLRTHEGNLPDESLQVYTNEKIAKAFAYWSKEFAKLHEYRKSVFTEAAEKGWPAVRPVWFENPDCKLCYDIDDQFFLGSDYLIAPIMEAGSRQRKVYLPTGKWKRLYHNRESAPLPGDRWMIAEAPVGHPAVFKRIRSETN